MSQQNIYQVQLLNDLHNYFPDILYNSGRFRNVQDLLEYIRQVADTSPYSRGLTSYNNRQTLNARVNASRAPPTYRSVGLTPPTAPIPTTAPTISAPPIPTTNATWAQPVMSTVFEEHIPTTRIRVPLNTASTANTTMLMNTILGSMFSDLFAVGGGGGDAGLQGFLNQRVPVYPSAQEIDRATTLFRAGSNRQGDICTICQDDIDINQELRILDHCSHSFHRDCIDTWLQGNVNCPTCRHDIREVTSTRNALNENVNRAQPQDNRVQQQQEQQQQQQQDSRPQNSPPPVPDNYRRMNILRPDI
uniref:RING-type domain-containing protein n=1 Tax=viral metagenome TaxID=1070528 RepID=A0A6C0DYR7_9ZZZZ